MAVLTGLEPAGVWTVSYTHLDLEDPDQLLYLLMTYRLLEKTE